MIRCLIQPTLWLVRNPYMHNSLTYWSHSPSKPQNEFLIKNIKVKRTSLVYPFHTIQQHYFTKNRKKEKRTSLAHWKSHLIKLHFDLTPRSPQRTFEQVSYFLPFKISDWNERHQKKTVKLLLQRRKGSIEMKASFLFNILGTITDNL